MQIHADAHTRPYFLFNQVFHLLHDGAEGRAHTKLSLCLFVCFLKIENSVYIYMCVCVCVCVV